MFFCLLDTVYVLPPSSRQKKDRKILGYLKGITRSINLSSGYLRVRTVCPSHTPKHKTPYTFIYFQLSVMFGESFRLVVACCCSFFVVAGSVPLRVKKMRLCFAVRVGRFLFVGYATDRLPWRHKLKREVLPAGKKSAPGLSAQSNDSTCYFCVWAKQTIPELPDIRY